MKLLPATRRFFQACTDAIGPVIEQLGPFNRIAQAGGRVSEGGVDEPSLPLAAPDVPAVPRPGVLRLLSLLSQESFRWPLTPLASAAWLYLVVFGSLMAFTAYMVLFSTTSTTLASSYTFINPVIGLLLGISLGGEAESAWEWVAVAIVVAGVTVVVLARGNRPAVATTDV